MSSLRHVWRQAGTTGRAHLVAVLPSPLGSYLASMSACGMVRHAAWVPERDATRCGLCRRLARQAEARGAPMVRRRREGRARHPRPGPGA